MTHPLLGADLRTLSTIFRRGGRPDRLGLSAAIWASALLRSPLTAIEQVFLSGNPRDASQFAPPIFIIGHWRSGTTLLYNLMSTDGFGFVPPVAVGLPWNFLGLGRALKPVLDRALPENRWIDRMPVTPDSPQEDEIALASMSGLSFYNGLYFPKAFQSLVTSGVFLNEFNENETALWRHAFLRFLQKLSVMQKSTARRPMLIKNPVYTGRIGLLLEMFPKAKFIHIHRDPLDVFLSMRNFYKRLLPELALQTVPDEIELDETILATYDRLMSRYLEEKTRIPEGQFVELGYDDLCNDPVSALRTVYEDLSIPDFDAAVPGFRDHLLAVQDYRRNSFQLEPAAVDLMSTRWQRWFRHWGYTDPRKRARGEAAAWT
ncbi:MAG: sulfotransferase [Pseudomonadota bacterium]